MDIKKKTSFKLVDHVTDCRLGPRAVNRDMSESVVCQAFYEDCQGCFLNHYFHSLTYCFECISK